MELGFYVSAKWQLVDEVRRAFALIQEKGHHITEDWTTHESVKPYDKEPETSARFAELDLTGVLESDVFIHLSDGKGTGKYIELGAAMASFVYIGSPRIYIIGENNNESQFYMHPSVNRKKTVEEVLKEITEISAE
ncbi:hypothetical protein ACFL96_11000 [Thermoproteota archaeon]